MKEILTVENKSEWSDPSYWETILLKELSVSKTDYRVNENIEELGQRNDTCEKNVKDCSNFRARLIEDGYALVDSVGKNEKSKFNELTNTLKRGISELHKKKIPAVFIILFDEAWEYAKINNRILSESTHSANCFNFDVLAWYIDPKENASGFSPHRDRQPEVTKDSFHKDDQAKYVTLWTALSDATPENSCLYIIPKQYDPGYIEGDNEEEDPLQRALSTKESYQHIRALPRKPGQSVMFTHRILHWGSRGNSKTSIEPRIAISFVCSDPKFERPYVNAKYFEEGRIPPFRIRLLLVCAQLLIYYQRFDLPKTCIRACYEYCKEHEKELDETYRGKLGTEFVKAMKETNLVKKVEGSISCDDDDNDDDDDEAMLEEMLEAETKGYGEFSDDFDDEAESYDASDNNNNCESSDDEEEAGENTLFGKRSLFSSNEDSQSKKTRISVTNQ